MQDFSRVAGMYLPGPQIVYWHFTWCCQLSPDILALNQEQVQISSAEGQSGRQMWVLSCVMEG